MNTVSRYAIVENGVVSNICLWDGNVDKWSPPSGSNAIELADTDYVSIGALYDGVHFSNPDTSS